MQLELLTVQNLRGVVSATIDFYKYTTLIGPNNCGKSTVLRAIQLLLDQEKPEPDEWHQGKEKDPIIITGKFKDITDEERKLSGISGLVQDGTINLRVVYVLSEGKVNATYQAHIRPETISGFTDVLSEAGNDIQAAAKKLGLDGKTWRSGANKEKVREIIRKDHPELVTAGDAEWNSESISIDPALKQGMPRVLIVPAVRDARDESRITQRKNSFAEIFREEILPEIKGTKEYKTMTEQAGSLRKMISGAADGLNEAKKIAGNLSAAAKPILDLAITLSIDDPELGDVFGSSARFSVNSGQCHTSVNLQGHGAQRTLIFSLVQYVAERGDIKRKGADKRSILLLFEEPELYIHPQLLRNLCRALKSIADRPSWQVAVTTHSPIMIDVANKPQSLAIFRRESAGILVKQLKTDPFEDEKAGKNDRAVLRATLDFHPTVCEAFFATSVILVEGDSEVAVLSQAGDLAATLELPLDTSGTTIVSCDGKWTIVPIARLLKAFEVPYKVVHDTDLPADIAADETADGTNAAITANSAIEQVAGKGNIFAVHSTLEDILYEKPGTRFRTDKPIRAWRRIERLKKDKALLAKHEGLIALLKFIFPLKT